MDYRKKSVRDVDLAGKRVLLRCDFNVPMENGEITDDNRITESLPTIEYLIENNARVIICSHLGRPKGQFNPEFSLKPAAERLSELLGKPVIMAEDVIGDSAFSEAEKLAPGGVMLLENLRFHPEEEANDPEFAKKLASLAEVFVSDAFGAAHRAHASTAGAAAYLPAVAGFLLAKELDFIGSAISNPKRPLTAILGGSKVSDKLGVIENLLNIADTLILGGGISFTFIKALGGEIGGSLCEDDRLEYARNMKSLAEKRGVKLLIRCDTLAAPSLDSEDVEIYPSDKIPDDLSGMDIGPLSVEMFTEELKNAKTVIWNGPMGVFERKPFEGGTRAIAQALAESSAITIIGGGDSAAAVRKYGLDDKMTHISTGGGATLALLEGRVLPGVACLLDK